MWILAQIDQDVFLDGEVWLWISHLFMQASMIEQCQVPFPLFPQVHSNNENIKTWPYT